MLCNNRLYSIGISPSRVLRHFRPAWQACLTLYPRRPRFIHTYTASAWSTPGPFTTFTKVNKSWTNHCRPPSRVCLQHRQRCPCVLRRYSSGHAEVTYDHLLSQISSRLFGVSYHHTGARCRHVRVRSCCWFVVALSGRRDGGGLCFCWERVLWTLHPCDSTHMGAASPVATAMSCPFSGLQLRSAASVVGRMTQERSGPITGAESAKPRPAVQRKGARALSRALQSH